MITPPEKGAFFFEKLPQLERILGIRIEVLMRSRLAPQVPAGLGDGEPRFVGGCENGWWVVVSSNPPAARQAGPGRWPEPRGSSRK